MMKNKSKPFSLEEHHRRHLVPLLKDCPFFLRITDWKDYPSPVLVLKSRQWRASPESDRDNQDKPRNAPCTEMGFIVGEPQRICLPVLRGMVERVRDRSGIPLELQRYLTTEGLRLRLNLPLDEDVGPKLGLIFRLQLRVKELDRVELIARRVARFTGEEAAYWLSRTVHFGPDASRWALSGLRVVLGGQPKDPAIPRMLDRLRAEM